MPRGGGGKSPAKAGKPAAAPSHGTKSAGARTGGAPPPAQAAPPPASGGWFGGKSAPAPAAAPAAPVAAAAPAAAPAAAGGMMSGLAGSMASGMAAGVGMSVANRAVDSMMGPRQTEVVHTHQGGAPPAADAPTKCVDEQKWLKECLMTKSQDECKNYADLLQSCRGA